MSSPSAWTYDSNQRMYFFLNSNRQRVDEPRSIPQEPRRATSQADPAYYTSSSYTPPKVDTLQGSQPSHAAQYSSAALTAGFRTLDLSNSLPSHKRESKLLGQQPESSPLMRNEFRRRKNPAEFFKTGKVFMLLWHNSTKVDRESIVSGNAWSRDSYDEWVYTKARRFIVVNSGRRSCIAVPITTNSGKGAAKEGVQKSDYCIVHSGKDVPPLGPGEAPSYAGEAAMQPQPIRVDLDTGEKLDPMSRINLAGPQTIQHHQKVKSIGKVHPKSMHSLEYQFKLVIGGPEPGPVKNTRESSTLSSEADERYKAVTVDGYTPQQAITILSQLRDDKQRRPRKISPLGVADDVHDNNDVQIDDDDNDEEEETDEDDVGEEKDEDDEDDEQLLSVPAASVPLEQRATT